MADPSSRRKLAAILSADVVGYSSLMAANEAATVETLKSYRDIIARLVVRRGGRVVNAPGDALLAEFPSAVEAVQAAIEIQKTLEGQNIELEPDRRKQFRIGVNLGDVIEETDGSCRMTSIATAAVSMFCTRTCIFISSKFLGNRLPSLGMDNGIGAKNVEELQTGRW
jgi:class 3 adenylate cyclase